MLNVFLVPPRRAGQIVILLSAVLLAGCQSPEERAQGYYEKGMALIEKKDDLNARVQLTTALVYKSDKIEAWRALAGIEERLKVDAFLVPGFATDRGARPQGYRFED